jgi:hypothetical protein
MRIKYVPIAFVLVLLVANCCFAVTWKVVDADTGEPIEGAVVLVEWTKKKGLPGFTHTKVYKIIEKETDMKGEVRIKRVLNPFVDPPCIVIYKQGYVAWRNDYIFPDYKKRTDFKFGSSDVKKLEKWKAKYSHSIHHLFMSSGILSSGLKHVPKFHKLLNEESKLSTIEAEKRKKERKR